MLFKLRDKFPINFSNPIWASSLAVSHVPPLLINVERSSRFSDRDNWVLLKLPYNPKYDLIPQSCALNLILWPWNVYPARPVGMEYRTGVECETYSSGVGIKYRTGACPALYSES